MNLRAWANPSYAVRRVGLAIYEFRHPDEPWIAPGAVAFCESYLNRSQVVLEWGSGRSTLWFAKRSKHLTSVEHAESWYNRISQQINEARITNVSYLFHPLHHSQDIVIPFVDRMRTSYVRIADSFEDASLDLVVVDGHYREACIKAVLEKLRPSGFLVVDNTDWLPLEQWGVPFNWQVVHQSRNLITQTTIWQKPGLLPHVTNRACNPLR